jgi:hypothetical protein
LCLCSCGAESLTFPGKLRAMSSSRTAFSKSRSRADPARSRKNTCTAVLAALPRLPVPGVSFTLYLTEVNSVTQSRMTTYCVSSRAVIHYVRIRENMIRRNSSTATTDHIFTDSDAVRNCSHFVQSTAHRAIQFGLCNPLISRALVLISNCKCIA